MQRNEQLTIKNRCKKRDTGELLHKDLGQYKELGYALVLLSHDERRLGLGGWGEALIAPVRARERGDESQTLFPWPPSHPTEPAQKNSVFCVGGVIDFSATVSIF